MLPIFPRRAVLARRQLEHLQLVPQVIGEVAGLDRDRLDIFHRLELLARAADIEAVEEDLLPVDFVVLLGLLVLLFGGLFRHLLVLRLLQLEERVVEQLLLEVLLEVEHRHVEHVHRLVQARIDAEFLAKPGLLMHAGLHAGCPSAPRRRAVMVGPR